MRLVEKKLYEHICAFPQFAVKLERIYRLQGAKAAKQFVRHTLRIKPRANEIRSVLFLDQDRGAFLAQEAHREAWQEAGYAQFRYRF
ncbi:MAG: hypothetical protein K6U74_04175 [Firmicutes bacterium]|nr:hypothetical protein [Bacillota bacterium]